MSARNHENLTSNRSRAEIPALVPREGRFEGQIAIAGETLIDGAVQGSLRGPGTLRLGTGAYVEGPIDCENLDSQGRIIGPVTATGHVRLGAGTHFEGDLEAPALDVDDDAIWTGRAKVGP